MRPGVTLAMIVRNEAAKLRRCLESVRPAVDDIVVVDTGSTDETATIAQEFEARIQTISWPDSFSEARNVSLSMVESEWVLWLDADEWFVDGMAAQVQQAIHAPGAFGYLLVRRDLYPNGAFSEQHMLRLWKHDPQFRFFGAVHEHLNLDHLASRFPGSKLKTTEIAFWHDGYSPTLTPEKALRNLPLLRKDVASNPETLYYEFELAQTLKTLGQPEGSELESDLADRLAAMRDLDEPPDNTAALFLMRFLADLSDDDLRTERSDAMLRLSRGWFPDHPGVRYLCAQVEIRRKELRRALDDLQEVEQMAESSVYDRLTNTHPAALGEGLSINLALVAHQLGRFDLAAKHYRRLLQLDPEHPIARQNLKELGASVEKLGLQ